MVQGGDGADDEGKMGRAQEGKSSNQLQLAALQVPLRQAEEEEDAVSLQNPVSTDGGE